MAFEKKQEVKSIEIGDEIKDKFIITVVHSIDNKPRSLLIRFINIFINLNKRLNIIQIQFNIFDIILQKNKLINIVSVYK